MNIRIRQQAALGRKQPLNPEYVLKRTVCLSSAIACPSKISRGQKNGGLYRAAVIGGVAILGTPYRVGRPLRPSYSPERVRVKVLVRPLSDIW